MTLTIIFGVLVLIGIGLCVWEYVEGDYGVWRPVTGTLTIFTAGIALIINLFIWLPSQGDSAITYAQLVEEKRTIEAMLNTERDVDRLLLNTYVIKYNNRIIQKRANCDRLIYREYYNQGLDWKGLELIEWDNNRAE